MSVNFDLSGSVEPNPEALEGVSAFEEILILGSPTVQKNLHGIVEKALHVKDVHVDLKERDVKPQTVEELFAANSLLIRAVDADEVFEDLPFTDRCKLGSLRMEMEYLKGKKGLQHTSSTLVVPEAGVTMYKSLGFLFNGQTSNIEHIYGIDSNSSTDDSGNLEAGSKKELLFDSLEALTTAIFNTDLLTKSRMNEVNGNFFTKDLVGLVSRVIPNKATDALLNLKIRSIQKLIFEKYKIELPVYKYDETKGKLVKLLANRGDTENELRAAQGDPSIKGQTGKIKNFLLGHH